MEQIVSFSDYDLFADLMVGLAAFALMDIVLGSGFLWRPPGTWNSGTTASILIGAYVLGQVVAYPATVILEEGVVDLGLYKPATFLLDKPAAQNDDVWHVMGRKLFDYYTPLDDRVIDAFQAKVRKTNAYNCESETNIRKKGQCRLWTALPAAKLISPVMERMTTFSKLYNFCRNMSFVGFFTAIIAFYRCCRPDAKLPALLISRGVQPWFTDPRRQCIVLFVVSLILFDRYLFFYRLYFVEVLSGYAFSSAAAG